MWVVILLWSLHVIAYLCRNRVWPVCLDEFFSCFEKIATVILVGVPQIRQKPSCNAKTVLSILPFLRSKDLNGNRHFYFKSCFCQGRLQTVSNLQSSSKPECRYRQRHFKPKCFNSIFGRCSTFLAVSSSYLRHWRSGWLVWRSLLNVPGDYIHG